MKDFKKLTDNENILAAIDDMGISTPTEIQEKVVPSILANNNVLLLSQTGSGKTLAFGMPLVETATSERVIQKVVLCPTRELAVQVSKEIQKIAKFSKSAKPFAVFGGQDIRRQINALKDKPNIVVATPGRLLDHIKRKTIRLSDVSTIVLDEADEMLRMGFREDMDKILSHAPHTAQIVLSSATMSNDIAKITKKYLNNAERIEVGTTNTPAESVSQQYLTIKQKNKKDMFVTLVREHLNSDKASPIIVFCNTKRMTTALADYLKQQDYSAAALNGDMRQGERTRTLNGFRKGKIEILVATDVAARGIDVDTVRLIINYDFPAMQEYYIHRIGRTGRAGKKGESITLLSTTLQISNMRALAKQMNFEIKEHTDSVAVSGKVVKAVRKSDNNRNGSKSRSAKRSYNKGGKSSSYGSRNKSRSDERADKRKSRDDKDKKYSDRKPRRDDDNRKPRRDDDRKPRRDDDNKRSYSKGKKSSYGSRDDKKRSYGNKDSKKKSYGNKDSKRKSYGSKKVKGSVKGSVRGKTAMGGKPAGKSKGGRPKR